MSLPATTLLKVCVELFECFLLLYTGTLDALQERLGDEIMKGILLFAEVVLFLAALLVTCRTCFRMLRECEAISWALLKVLFFAVLASGSAVLTYLLFLTAKNDPHMDTVVQKSTELVVQRFYYTLR